MNTVLLYAILVSLFAIFIYEGIHDGTRISIKLKKIPGTQDNEEFWHKAKWDSHLLVLISVVMLGCYLKNGILLFGIIFYVINYTLVRFVVFDYMCNIFQEQDPWYIGNTSKHDKFYKKYLNKHIKTIKIITLVLILIEPIIYWFLIV